MFTPYQAISFPLGLCWACFVLDFGSVFVGGNLDNCFASKVNRCFLERDGCFQPTPLTLSMTTQKMTAGFAPTKLRKNRGGDWLSSYIMLHVWMPCCNDQTEPHFWFLCILQVFANLLGVNLDIWERARFFPPESPGLTKFDPVLSSSFMSFLHIA